MARDPRRSALTCLACGAAVLAVAPGAEAVRIFDLDPMPGGAAATTKDESEEVDRAVFFLADDASPPLLVEHRLGSGYGWRRSGRTGLRTFHAGLDFAAERGSDVVSVRPGTVVLVTRESERGNGMGGYGNSVVVYHKDEDLWVLYAHLDEVVVKPGIRVAAGQPLGTLGATSNGEYPGMGAHLHFEVRSRARDGEAPVPGRFRRHPTRPAAWLAAHGVRYRRGSLDEDRDEGGPAAPTFVIATAP